MKADTPLDYVSFQLSPKRTRCELFVSARGETEKLASGLLKPFVTHLKAAEEQVGKTGHLIKLEVPENRNGARWFTKGTLERFVRFVSTPEVLELVNTVDKEMSQLEDARNFQLSLYSQGSGDQPSGLGSDAGTLGAATKSSESDAAETSKRELLRAIDVRLMALQQELSMGFTRASAAGFALDHIADLIVFADRFGANRLKDACSKFMLLCQKRHDMCSWQDDADGQSSGSDMSIENGTELMFDSSSNSLLKKVEGGHIQGSQISGSTGVRTKEDQQLIKPSHSRAQSVDHFETIPSLSSGQNVIKGRESLSSSKNSYIKPDVMNKQVTEVKQESSTITSEKHKQVLADTNKLRSYGSGMSGSYHVDTQSSRGSYSNRESSDSDGESSGVDKQESETIQTAQPTRRLSVKDRISLFESKQNEQHRESSEGIRKIGKVENRRLSSESGNSVAAMEKAVLRRWSGASDMSVEMAPSQQTKIENNKDINASSTRSTSELYVTASENSVQSSFIEKDQGQIQETTPQSEFRPLINKQSIIEERKDVGLRFLSPPKVRGHQRAWSSASDYSDSFSDHQAPKPSSISSEEPMANMAKQSAPAAQFKVYSALNSVQDAALSSSEIFKRNESSKAGDQGSDITDGSMSTKPTAASRCGSEITNSALDMKQLLAARQRSDITNGSLDSKWSGISWQGSDKTYGFIDTNSLGPVRQEPDTTDGSMSSNKFGIEKQGSDILNGSGSKRRLESEETFAKFRQSKGNQELNEELREKANQLEAIFAAHKIRTRAAVGHPEDTEITKRKSSLPAVKYEVSTTQEQMSIPLESRLETMKFSSKGQERIFSMAVQNNGRESLGSSWSNAVDFDMHALKNMADPSYVSNSDKILHSRDDGYSEELRGKFYELYMAKRDAKLREESITKRVQKEAKLKVMQEVLERSKTELAARSLRSFEKQDPMVQARVRAEKLRSFNVRASKNKNQQFEAEESDDEEDSSDVQEQALYRQDRIITFNASSADMLSPHVSKESPKPGSVKRLSSNKSMPSTAQRGSMTSPSARSSMPGKVPSSSTSSGRRRGQENPLAQSVPNFGDLRKENTKPSPGRAGSSSIVGGVSRGQPKSSSRKSGNEDISFEANGSLPPSRSSNNKDEKQRRSQLMRKSYTSMSEIKDLCEPMYEGVVLAPLKAGKETSEQIFNAKGTKKNNGAPSEAKPFLRKGNGIGPGAGPGVAKMKASLAAESSKNAEDDGQTGIQNEEEIIDESGNVQSIESLEGFAEENVLDKNRVDLVDNSDAQADSDASQNEVQKTEVLNQASDKSDDAISDNDTISSTVLQAKDASASRNQLHNEEMVSSSGMRVGHAALVSQKHITGSPSVHLATGSTHFSPVMGLESPAESPASWNSHMHHSLSQMLEASDVEASDVEASHMGSPASWNSHSLSQMMEASDSDAARTRKKWGSAQKPVLIATQQPHKDVPKGFKRLLKFGRKNRGSEPVPTDWVSASTTSEGDDDTEDTRDLAVRSADDLLRKSRMGFAPMQPSYERSYDYGSLDSDSFHDQGTIQSLRSSIPAPPANFKLRDDPLSGGTSIKGPRSFFSLSSFRSKGSDSKSR